MNSSFTNDNMGFSRNIWMAITWLLTFWIPTVILKYILGKPADQTIKWREKLALFLLSIGASVGLFVGIDAGQRIVCGMLAVKQYTLNDIQSASDMIAVNGKAVKVESLKSSDKIDLAKKFAGKDLSALFPTFIYLGRSPGSNDYADKDIENCIATDAARQMADNWLRIRLNDPGYSVDNNQLKMCPLPDKSQGPCYTQPDDKLEILKASAGDIHYSPSDISSHRTVSNNDAFVAINGKVYSIGEYLNIVSNNQNTSFFGPDVLNTLNNGIGTDITSDFEKLSNAAEIQKCLDKLFFNGVTLAPASAQSLSLSSFMTFQDCKVINPVLYGLAAIFLIIFLPKYFMGFFMGNIPGKEPLSDANIVIMVNCYKETLDRLTDTVNSLINVRYNIPNKLLVFWCDGYDSNCNELLSILGFDARTCSASGDRSYISVGEGSRSFNTVKVYSGMHESNAYVVIHKIGTKYENPEKGSAAPGNRGTRDSMVALFSFLSKISKPQVLNLTSFDYELYKSLKKLHIDARRFEYALITNGSTTVDSESVLRLVNKMDSAEKLAALQGKISTKTSNPLRYYPFFIDTHLQSMINSFLGKRNIGTISGGATMNMVMLRLKYSDGTPLVLNNQLFDDFSNSYHPPEASMTLNNCFYKAEEKYVASSIIKRSNNYINYEPRAVGYVKADNGHDGSMYYSFEKSKIATFALRWNIITSNGCCSNFRSFFATLAFLFTPTATGYFYYLLISAFMNPDGLILSNIIAVLLFLLPFILNLIASLFHLDIFLFFSILLHMAIGLPLYNIIFHLLAFWNMSSSDRILTKNGTLDHGCYDKSESKEIGRAHVPRYALVEWEKGDQTGKFEEMAFSDYDNTMETSINISRVKPDSLDLFVPNTMNHSVDEPGFEEYAETIISSVPHTMSSAAYTEHGKLSQYFNRDSVMTKTVRESVVTDTTVPMNQPLPPSKDDKSIPSIPNSHQSNFYYQPTNFEGKQKIASGTIRPDRTSTKSKISTISAVSSHVNLSPMRAASIARSDYQSDFDGSESDRISKFRNTTISEASRQSRHSQSKSGDITKEEIRDEIRFFLQDADLNSITRREVKEHLYVQFGDVEGFNDFINVCIEEYTLEKLALL